MEDECMCKLVCFQFFFDELNKSAEILRLLNGETLIRPPSQEHHSSRSNSKYSATKRMRPNSNQAKLPFSTVKLLLFADPHPQLSNNSKTWKM